jgi:hypothetical protein
MASHITKSFVLLLLLLVVMEIPVTVETYNNFLIYDLLEEPSVTLGMKKELGNGLTVSYVSHFKRKAVGFPDVIQLSLIIAKDVGAPVAATLITAWLLKKLSPKEAKVEKLSIDRITVELDEGKIKKIVHEKIEKQ